MEASANLSHSSIEEGDLILFEDDTEPWGELVVLLLGSPIEEHILSQPVITVGGRETACDILTDHLPASAILRIKRLTKSDLHTGQRRITIMNESDSDTDAEVLTLRVPYMHKSAQGNVLRPGYEFVLRPGDCICNANLGNGSDGTAIEFKLLNVSSTTEDDPTVLTPSLVPSSYSKSPYDYDGDGLPWSKKDQPSTSKHQPGSSSTELEQQAAEISVLAAELSSEASYVQRKLHPTARFGLAARISTAPVSPQPGPSNSAVATEQSAHTPVLSSNKKLSNADFARKLLTSSLPPNFFDDVAPQPSAERGLDGGNVLSAAAAEPVASAEAEQPELMATEIAESATVAAVTSETAENKPKSAMPGSMADHLTCQICQAIFYDPVSIIPCNHVFCAGCLSMWLKSKKTQSPTCRVVVQTASEIHLVKGLAESFLEMHPEHRRTAEEIANLDKANNLTKNSAGPAGLGTAGRGRGRGGRGNYFSEMGSGVSVNVNVGGPGFFGEHFPSHFSHSSFSYPTDFPTVPSSSSHGSLSWKPLGGQGRGAGGSGPSTDQDPAVGSAASVYYQQEKQKMMQQMEKMSQLLKARRDAFFSSAFGRGRAARGGFTLGGSTMDNNQGGASSSTLTQTVKTNEAAPSSSGASVPSGALSYECNFCRCKIPFAAEACPNCWHMNPEYGRLPHSSPSKVLFIRGGKQVKFNDGIQPGSAFAAEEGSGQQLKHKALQIKSESAGISEGTTTSADTTFRTGPQKWSNTLPSKIPNAAASPGPTSTVKVGLCHCRQCPDGKKPSGKEPAKPSVIISQAGGQIPPPMSIPNFVCTKDTPHTSCRCCTEAMPLRDIVDFPSQNFRCTLCIRPFCHMYWGCKAKGCVGCMGRLEDYDPTLADIMLGMNVATNAIEAELLKAFIDELSVPPETISEAGLLLLDIQDWPEMHERGLQRESPICRECYKEVYLPELAFAYRLQMSSSMQGAVVGRPDCPFGRKCDKRIISSHAKKMNHAHPH